VFSEYPSARTPHRVAAPMRSASPEEHSAEPNPAKGENTPWPVWPRLSSPPCRCFPPRATAYLLGSFLYLVGRGLHRSTFQLNLSALYGIGGASKGVYGVFLCQTRLKLS
jgi:hypothetical protein